MNRKLSKLFAFAIFIASFVPMNSSYAIGSGVCTSDVNSTTGVVVANSGGSCYIAFTATGTNSWTPPSGISSADLLIIAGGGAGGAGAWSGGGGAGELVSYTSYTVTPGTALNLSVGRGGNSGTADLNRTLNRSETGTASWIGSASGVVAQGGGFGASYAYNSGTTDTNGGNGGSGGGGSEDYSASPGGTATKTSGGTRTGYGNNGGKGGSTGQQSGGGGGGAGAVGNDASYRTGGNGGSGTNLFSTWLTAINSQMSSAWQTATSTGYIAAGGGGGAATAGTAGTGGGGDGKNASTSGGGIAGVANTGSGGGGISYYNSTAQAGGAGGSGLIIIKYAIVTPTVTAFNLTGNATTATYRNSTTINITINTAAKVTFRAKGVVITACKNKTATGSGSTFTATCNWKPSIRGQINLTADIAPTGPWGNTSTAPLQIRVGNRSGTRA